MLNPSPLASRLNSILLGSPLTGDLAGDLAGVLAGDLAGDFGAAAVPVVAGARDSLLRLAGDLLSTTHTINQGKKTQSSDIYMEIIETESQPIFADSKNLAGKQLADFGLWPSRSVQLSPLRRRNPWDVLEILPHLRD